MEIRIGNKVFSNEDTYYEEIKKLQSMMTELNFNLTYEETKQMWLEISDKFAASFLIIPKDLEELKEYLEWIEV